MGVIQWEEFRPKKGFKLRKETYTLCKSGLGFQVLSEGAKEPETISWEAVDIFLQWLQNSGGELKLNIPVGRKMKEGRTPTWMQRPEGILRQSLPYQLARALKACFPDITELVLGQSIFKMTFIPIYIEVVKAIKDFCQSNTTYTIGKPRTLKTLR